jgi:hypothetical protein
VRAAATDALHRNPAAAVAHAESAAVAAPVTSSADTQLRALVLVAHAEMEQQRAETLAERMESLWLASRGVQGSSFPAGDDEESPGDEKKTVKALRRMRLETLAQAPHSSMLDNPLLSTPFRPPIPLATHCSACAKT